MDRDGKVGARTLASVSLTHGRMRAGRAEQCDNTDCRELVEIVVQMLTLWDEYLLYRERMIAGSLD
jgi:hypothetical protein